MRLFVVADNPLDEADVEYGALDAAHYQRNRAKRHDKSPKQIRSGLRATVSRMVLPARQLTFDDIAGPLASYPAA